MSPKSIRISAILAVGLSVGAVVYSNQQVRLAGSTRQPETLIVSLNGEPAELTSADDGVYFDIDGVGQLRKVGWTRGGKRHALLALDENHNGRIDNGSELVGGANGPPKGFDYLAAFDGFRSLRDAMNPNSRRPDGRIDSDDEIFKRLILWTDLNHDGVSQEKELQSLSFAGIVRLDVTSRTILSLNDGGGNSVRARSRIDLRAGNGEMVAVRLAKGALR